MRKIGVPNGQSAKTDPSNNQPTLTSRTGHQLMDNLKLGPLIHLKTGATYAKREPMCKKLLLMKKLALGTPMSFYVFL